MKNILSFALAGLALAFWGCSSSGQGTVEAGAGASPAVSGGSSGVGGTLSGAGGTNATSAPSGIGGASVTGGANGTGGNTATGGRSAAGGVSGGTGGATSTTSSTGGASATGGANGTGGSTSAGGAPATGGIAGSGGATGGRDAGNDDGRPSVDVGLGTGGVPKTGGSTGSGGNTGSGGSPGSDAGTTPPNCTAVPVTPNATQQTRNVLCYLHSIYGNGILSGQEEDNNDNGMNTVFAATGKYPAIRAFDVNNSQAPTQCVAHWNNGGICMFGYHMGINGGTYSTKTNIDNVLAAGTAENTSFNADLDRIAQFVQPLKAAGGVAILRMFHEAGAGCSWFWWSMGTSTQWQSLFKYAFNYLTATKGLNNVLWLAPLCQHPTAAYNPGAQYIDLGGADNYVAAGDTEPMTSIFQQAQTAFPNMMVALHECGTIPDPDQLKSTATKWLLFNVWANPYFNAPYNTAAHLQAVYSNPYVITRDKLPSFK
jgi:hypothetical protein